MAQERFTVLLSFLLSSMLVHGVAPAGLILSTMIPIPKSKRGQKCSSDIVQLPKQLDRESNDYYYLKRTM